jgi:hypothetical protein
MTSTTDTVPSGPAPFVSRLTVQPVSQQKVIISE